MPLVANPDLSGEERRPCHRCKSHHWLP